MNKQELLKQADYTFQRGNRELAKKYLAELLTKYPNSFMSHISDKNSNVFCEYNFRPVKQNDKATVPDYLENKHLYLIKILNGTISRAW